LNYTREELVAQFEGVSVQPQSILGIWVHEGVRYEDTSVRMTVDVEDTPENRQFFAEFKKSSWSVSSNSKSTLHLIPWTSFSARHLHLAHFSKKPVPDSHQKLRSLIIY
jgi:hypothetical protein